MQFFEGAKDRLKGFAQNVQRPEGNEDSLFSLFGASNLRGERSSSAMLFDDGGLLISIPQASPSSASPGPLPDATRRKSAMATQAKLPPDSAPVKSPPPAPPPPQPEAPELGPGFTRATSDGCATVKSRNRKRSHSLQARTAASPCRPSPGEDSTCKSPVGSPRISTGASVEWILEQREIQLREMAEKLSSAEELSQTLADDVQRKDAELSSLRDVVKAADNNQRLQKAAEDAKTERDQLKDEGLKLSVRVSQLEQRIQKLRAELAETKLRLEGSQKSESSVKAALETANLKLNLLESSDAKLSDASVRLSHLEGQKMRLEADLGKALETLNSNKRDSARASSLEAETIEMRKALEAAEAKQREMLGDSHALRDQLQYLSDELATQETRDRHSSQALQEDLEEHRSRIEDMKTEMASLTTPYVESVSRSQRALESALSAKRAIERSFTEFKASAEGRIGELEAQLSRNPTHQVEALALQLEDVASRGGKREKSLEEALAAKSSALLMLEENLAMAEASVRRAEAEVHSCREQMASQEERYNTAMEAAKGFVGQPSPALASLPSHEAPMLMNAAVRNVPSLKCIAGATDQSAVVACLRSDVEDLRTQNQRLEETCVRTTSEISALRHEKREWTAQCSRLDSNTKQIQSLELQLLDIQETTEMYRRQLAQKLEDFVKPA